MIWYNINCSRRDNYMRGQLLQLKSTSLVWDRVRDRPPGMSVSTSESGSGSESTSLVCPGPSPGQLKADIPFLGNIASVTVTVSVSEALAMSVSVSVSRVHPSVTRVRVWVRVVSPPSVTVSVSVSVSDRVWMWPCPGPCRGDRLCPSETVSESECLRWVRVRVHVRVQVWPCHMSMSTIVWPPSRGNCPWCLSCSTPHVSTRTWARTRPRNVSVIDHEYRDPKSLRWEFCRTDDRVQGPRQHLIV